MTAQVIPLTINRDRQDALAHELQLQRLERQHRQAAMREEVLDCITKAEAQVRYWQSVVDFGLVTLARIDGGPNDAA